MENLDKVAWDEIARQRDALAEVRDMATTWTPGPWIVFSRRFAYKEADGIADGHNGYVVAKSLTHSLIGDDEAAANIRLIASAPELYEALKELLAATVFIPLTGDDHAKKFAAQQKAEAAMKKARGE